VIDEQAAIMISAWYYWSIDPNLFTIETNVASVDQMWYVRDEILKALAKLRTEEVSNQMLDRVKSNLKYKAALGLTSAENIADTIQYYAFLNGGKDDPELIPSHLNLKCQ